jgi:hypothetical protein
MHARSLRLGNGMPEPMRSMNVESGFENCGLRARFVICNLDRKSRDAIRPSQRGHFCFALAPLEG